MTQVAAVFEHIPHPHTRAMLAGSAPAPPKVDDERIGFNGKLGLFLTTIVGTMWAAYLFTSSPLLVFRRRSVVETASSSSRGSRRRSSNWSSSPSSLWARTFRLRRLISGVSRLTRTPRRFFTNARRSRRISPRRTTCRQIRSLSCRTFSTSYADDDQKAREDCTRVIIEGEMRRLIAVVGPTASGKTSLAVELAPHLDGEIIGADSRQVYHHMDIGTAKPTLEEPAAAAHHLIEVVEPHGPFSLGRWLDLAKDAPEDIWR